MSAMIMNEHVRVDVDVGSGLYNVWLGDDTPVVLNASSTATWHGGGMSSTDPRLERSITRGPIADAIGRGTQVTLVARDPEQRCSLSVRIALYDGLGGFTVESTLYNEGPAEIWIREIQPCHIMLANGAALYPPGGIRRPRVLTNGYLYSDPGRVEVLSSNRSVQSCWNIAVNNPVNGNTLVAGYVSHDRAETELTVDFDARIQPIVGRHGLGFRARSLFGASVALPPGDALCSDTLLVTWATTADGALRTYGRIYRDRNSIRVKPPLMGWCSWYYTYRQVTEEEVLRNARFVAEHLKDYGLDLIQIDDGFQRRFGDWEGNERFPHGLTWLATEIRKLGLRPGLWVAPYVIDADSEIAREHADWLGRCADGEVKLCRMGSRGGYALDPTHPEARAWLRTLFRRIGDEWGYDMVKLDFVEWSVLAIERYHDPSISRAGAYRLGLQTIRDALGPDCHILDCGPLTAAGICDSWRIELDFDRLNWRQYTKELESNAPAIAKRYYLHRNFWSNDPDHVGFALLSESQARAVASIMALSGGTIISGDRLYALPEDKIAILKKILPVFGEAAQPLDLFETDFPTLFYLPVTRPFGTWHVLGIFNWDESAWKRQTVPLERLGLDDKAPYVVHEFWSQQLLPIVSGAISVDLAPASCVMLAIRSSVSHPDLVGTDRHVLQGAVELVELYWDPDRRRLFGTLNAIARSRPTLTVAVPERFRCLSMEIDGQPRAVGELRPGLLRIAIPADRTGLQHWSVQFGEHENGPTEL